MFVLENVSKSIFNTTFISTLAKKNSVFKESKHFLLILK